MIRYHDFEHDLTLRTTDFEHEHNLDCKYFVKNNVILKPTYSGLIHAAQSDGPLPQVESGGSQENIWTLFTSRKEWELAQWAKLHGPGSTAFSKLLEIERVSHVQFFS